MGKGAKFVINKYADKVLKKAKLPPRACMKPSTVFSPPKGSDALDAFKRLANKAAEAFSTSTLCTCETSGRVQESNNFIMCADSGASCCDVCAPQYRCDTHNMQPIKTCLPVGQKRSTSVQDFNNEIRQLLPAQLYIPKDAVSKLAEVEGDVYGVKGMDNFVFHLSRVANDRQRWRAFYKARANNGTGNCIAQIEVIVGALIIGSDEYGVEAKLFCYQPTLDNDVRGVVEECLRLRYPAGASPSTVKWEIRGTRQGGQCALIGSKPEASTRVKMGITEKSVSGPYGVHKGSVTQKKFFDRDVKRGDKLRWNYPDNWKEWPGEIEVKGFKGDNKDLNGTYIKRKCSHSVPHSALWTKDPEDGIRRLHIVIKPNVSRVRPDVMAISESPSPFDSTRYRVEMDYQHQPCHSLLEEKQHDVKCLTTTWTESEAFKVVVPENNLKITAPKVPANPAPEKVVSVAKIKGFQTDVLDLLKEHTPPSKLPSHLLNLFDGIDGQKTKRMFSAFVATPFQTFASSKDMKFSLKDTDTKAWLELTAGSGPKFGTDQEILPDRPREAWVCDVERTKHQKTPVYIRRPDADESKIFKEAMAARPHGFEVYLTKDGDVDITIRPHVHSHLAAHALLHHRGHDDTDLKVSYRLLDNNTMNDPKVDEFIIGNTKDYKATQVHFKDDLKLFERQGAALTKLLQIDDGLSDYVEVEMSEATLGSMTIAAKAENKVALRGGVLADAIGAGKTVVSIALIISRLEKSRTTKKLKGRAASQSAASLIVVPPGLISQWKEEFEKFVKPETKLNCVEIWNIKSLMNLTVAEVADADVVIVPIDLLEGDKRTKGQYLQHIFQFVSSKMGKKAVDALGHQYDLAKPPPLFRHKGVNEIVGVEGVWVSKTSGEKRAKRREEERTRSDDTCDQYLTLSAATRFAPHSGSLWRSPGQPGEEGLYRILH